MIVITTKKQTEEKQITELDRFPLFSHMEKTPFLKDKEETRSD